MLLEDGLFCPCIVEACSSKVVFISQMVSLILLLKN
jgi:hypothetical protein